MGPPTLLLLGVALSSASSPGPPAARVACWFVEETGGGGSVMPSALSQRRALLLLPPPGRRMDERLEPEVPVEVEPGLAFQILDPSGILWGGSESSTAPLWLGADPDQVSCEINAYSPQEAHVSWAAGLVGEEGCPRSLEKGKWFITTIQNPEAGYGVSSILHEEEQLPWKQEAAASSITTAAAVLSVFTRTPQVQSRLGQDVVLDCGFSAPAAPFSVEWRHQHRGAGRVILAYDGAAERISVSEKGVELFLDPESNNISLCLRNVGVHREGTYICTVYLPHLHAQQALELKTVEPPLVTLRPIPLLVSPSSQAELACEISGYYPLGVSVSWKRQSPGTLQEVLLDTWESGHRQSPDGTFSLTSFARLGAVQPEDHGASYSCHVAHIGLGAAGLQKAVKLHVAGSSGPSVEDAIGLFLVAFVLYGILRLIFRRIAVDTTKTQKLE
ncbi:tapasin-like [Eublepharis macularius]|uniref:Tapasin-like n=1 Tax=Eublepharis macularius TaxID=481883 RepID=A0AA97JAB2_EUBMA|nr:tapasin-like [Eublepharis macularius]